MGSRLYTKDGDKMDKYSYSSDHRFTFWFEFLVPRFAVVGVGLLLMNISVTSLFEYGGSLVALTGLLWLSHSFAKLVSRELTPLQLLRLALIIFIPILVLSYY